MDLRLLSNGVAAAFRSDSVVVELDRQGAPPAERTHESVSAGREHTHSETWQGAWPGLRQLIAAHGPLLLQVAAWGAAIGIVLAIKRFG